MRVKELIPCFGINPRTGERVGSRHRWPDGWGVGICKYCDRTIEQVTRDVETETAEAEKNR